MAIDNNDVEIGIGARLQLLNLPEVQAELQKFAENDVTIPVNANISQEDIIELLKYSKGNGKGGLGGSADKGLQTLIGRTIKQQASSLNKANERLNKAITQQDFSAVFGTQGEIKGLLSSITSMGKLYSKAFGTLDDFKIGDKTYNADTIANFGKEIQSRISGLDFTQVGQSFGKALKEGGEALTPIIKEAVQNAIITVGKEVKSLQSKMLKSDYDVSGASEDYSRLVTLQTVLNSLMDDTDIKHIKKDKENDIPSISKSTIAGQTSKIEEKMLASGIDIPGIKESALKVVNSNEILGQILKQNVIKVEKVASPVSGLEVIATAESKTPKSIPKALKDSLRPQLNKIYDYENNPDSKITGEEFDKTLNHTKEIFTEMAKIDYDKAKSVFLGLADEVYLLDEFKDPGHEDDHLPSKKGNEVFNEMRTRYELPSKEDIDKLSISEIEPTVDINTEKIEEEVKEEISGLNGKDIGTIYISNVRLAEGVTLFELRQDIEERLNAEPIKVTISTGDNTDEEGENGNTNIRPQVEVDISGLNISDEAVLSVLKTRIEQAVSPILITGIDTSETELEALKQKINDKLQDITIGRIEIKPAKTNDISDKTDTYDSENTKSNSSSDQNKKSNKTSTKPPLTDGTSNELTEAGKIDSQVRSAKSDLTKINTQLNKITKNIEQLSKLGETEGLDESRETVEQYKKTISDLRTKLKAIKAIPEDAERLTNVLEEINKIDNDIDQMLTSTETKVTETKNNIKSNKEVEKAAQAEKNAQAKQAEKANAAGLQTQARLDRGIPGVEKRIESLEKVFNDAVRVLGSDKARTLVGLTKPEDGISNTIKIYKTQLEEIKTLMSGGFDLNNIENANKKYEELTNQLNKLIDKLKEESSVQKKQNTNTKSYENLISKMTGYQNANSRLFKDENLANTFNEIMQAAQNMNVPIAQLELRFKKLQTQAMATGYAGRSLTGQFKNLFEVLGDRAIISLVIEGLKQAAREMYNNVREIDSAMTQVKKVTDETNATYDKFLSNAGTKAEKLGATMSEVISSTADFAKLGYNLNEASALADSAIIYSNVGDLDIQTATQDLVSATKAFDMSADETMKIVDSFNEVGNRFAVSAQQLGEGLQNSASTLVVAGNSMDESIAMLTGMTEITQDAASAGAALRTIALRIRGAKTELDGLGESTEGMAVSTAKLRDKIKGMTGVDIMLDEKNFKSTYQIMKELSEVWDDLSDIDRSAVLELIAGKNRSNQAGALLSNFSQVESALKTSLNAAGSAAKENEAYLNSIEGKLSQLKATLQDLSADFLKSDTVKGAIDLLNNLAKAADLVVENVGAMPLVFNALWAALASKKATPFGIVPEDLVSSTGIKKVKTGVSSMLSWFDSIKSQLNTRFNSKKSGKKNTDNSSQSIEQTDNIQKAAERITEAMERANEEAEEYKDKMQSAGEASEEAGEEAAEATSQAGEEISEILTGDEGILGGFSSLLKSLAGQIIAGLIVWGIQQIYNGIEHAVHKTKYDLQELDEIQGQREETKSELDEVSNKLEEIQERIAEIKSEPLTFTSEEELKNLQAENEELALRQQLLQDIEESQAKAYAEKNAPLLQKQIYASGNITENTLSKMMSNYHREMTTDQQVMYGTLARANVEPPPADFSFEDLIKYLPKLNEDGNWEYNDYTLEDLTLIYEQLLELNKNFTFDNSSDVRDYFELQKVIEAYTSTLLQTQSDIAEQKSQYSSDSEDFKHLTDIYEKTAELLASRDERSDDILTVIKQDIIRARNETDPNYGENYPLFVEQREVAKEKFDSKGKGYVVDFGKAADLDEETLNFLQKQQGWYTDIRDGNLKITLSYYEQMEDILYNINKEKEKGNLLDEEAINNLETQLYKRLDLNKEEGDGDYLTYSIEDKTYAAGLEYLRNRNWQDITAETYKEFESTMTGFFTRDGYDPDVAKELLAALFPDFQTIEGLLGSYFHDTNDKIISEALDYSATHSTDDLQKYIDDNEELKTVLKDLGIEATDFAIAIQKVTAAERQNIQQEFSKRIQENKEDFYTDKGEYDNSYASIQEKFTGAIGSISSGGTVSYEDAFALIGVDQSLAEKFTRTADGYTIALSDLTTAQKNYTQSAKDTFKTNIENSEQIVSDLEARRDKIEKEIEEVNAQKVTAVPAQYGGNYEELAAKSAALDKELEEVNNSIDNQNAILSENRLMYDEVSASATDYSKQLSNVTSKLQSWKTAYSQAMSDINLTGTIAPDSILQLMELDPKNWVSMLEKNLNGGFTLNTDAFMESAKKALGIDGIIATNEAALDDYKEDLSDLAKKYNIPIDKSKDFYENCEQLSDIFSEMGEDSAPALEALDKIKEGYDNASEAGEILKGILETIAKLLEKSPALSNFENTVANLQHQLAMDEITQEQYDSGYAGAVNTLRNEADPNDTEAQKAIQEGEEQVHSAIISGVQNTFDKAVDDLNHELSMGNIDQDEYDQRYSKLVDDFIADAANKGVTDIEEINSAIRSAEEERHRNEQNKLKRELDEQTEELQDKYDRRLIDYDTYLNRMAELDKQYYGDENTKGLLDDPEGTNADDVHDQEVQRAEKVYSTEREKIIEDYQNGNISLEEMRQRLEDIADIIRDYPELSEYFKDSESTGLTKQDYIQMAESEMAEADKLLEQHMISNTQYALMMEDIWKRYFKDKIGFAQEDYDAQQKFLNAVKTDAQYQIDGVQSLIDKNKEAIDAQIEGIEKKNDEIENYYDKEIAKIDEQIDAIDKKADAEDRFYNLKKAEQELEKASQKTRKVYGSNGMVEYRMDQDAYDEAKKNYDDAKRDEEKAKLEEQKEALEKERDAKLQANNDLIEQLNTTLAETNGPLELLAAAMTASIAEQYNLSPEAIAALLSTDAAQEEIDRQNNLNKAKGQNTYTNEDLAKTGMAAATETNKKDPQKQKTADNQLMEGYSPLTPDGSNNKIANMVLWFMEQMNSGDKQVTVENALPKETDIATIPQTTTITSSNFNIGDIVISNPVANSYDLAKDLALNLPNAFQSQMYTNLKQ